MIKVDEKREAPEPQPPLQMQPALVQEEEAKSFGSQGSDMPTTADGDNFIKRINESLAPEEVKEAPKELDPLKDVLMSLYWPQIDLAV